MRVIAGKYKGLNISVQIPEGVRPTQDALRETIFNILNNYLDLEGANVLDIFAGTGALGIEALSRGASECVFVEKNPRVCGLIKTIIAKIPELQSTSRIVCKDAIRFLSKFEVDGAPFDLILTDPPYESKTHFEALSIISARELISSEGVIMMETKKNFALVPPENMEIIDERTFGDSKIFFIKLKK